MYPGTVSDERSRNSSPHQQLAAVDADQLTTEVARCNVWQLAGGSFAADDRPEASCTKNNYLGKTQIHLVTLPKITL